MRVKGLSRIKLKYNDMVGMINSVLTKENKNTKIERRIFTIMVKIIVDRKLEWIFFQAILQLNWSTKMNLSKQLEKIFLSGVACGAFENDVEALAM